MPTLVTYDAHRFGQNSASRGEHGQARQVRGAGLRSLEILQTAGVKIGYGTDLLGPMHATNRANLWSRRAMKPFDIIARRQWSMPNTNRTGEFGVVAPGARADLIAVDGDPLADISLLDGQGEHLTHIMKDGAFYKRLV